MIGLMLLKVNGMVPLNLKKTGLIPLDGLMVMPESLMVNGLMPVVITSVTKAKHMENGTNLLETQMENGLLVTETPFQTIKPLLTDNGKMELGYQAPKTHSKHKPLLKI